MARQTAALCCWLLGDENRLVEGLQTYTCIRLNWWRLLPVRITTYPTVYLNKFLHVQMLKIFSLAIDMLEQQHIRKIRLIHMVVNSIVGSYTLHMAYSYMRSMTASESAVPLPTRG